MGPGPMIAGLGGAGAGLVWGWLLGTRRVERASPLGVLWAAGASALLAIEAALIAGRAIGLLLLVAAVAGHLAHRAWRRELRARSTSLEEDPHA